jgi:hypothetical protein
MEATRYSETSVIGETTRFHIPEDSNLHVIFFRFVFPEMYTGETFQSTFGMSLTTRQNLCRMHLLTTDKKAERNKCSTATLSLYELWFFSCGDYYYPEDGGHILLWNLVNYILWQIWRYFRYERCYSTVGYGFGRFLRNDFPNTRGQRNINPLLGNVHKQNAYFRGNEYIDKPLLKKRNRGRLVEFPQQRDTLTKRCV